MWSVTASTEETEENVPGREGRFATVEADADRLVATALEEHGRLDAEGAAYLEKYGPLVRG